MLKAVFKFIIGLSLFISVAAQSKQIEIVTPEGGDFKLSQTTLGEFKLSQLKGRIVFLYFGFLSCSQVCPMTLNRLKEAEKMLQKQNLQSKVFFVFVTVDPRKDTLEKIKTRMALYGDRFVGGVANVKKLEKIMSQYGARYAQIKQPDGQTTIDHTDKIFAINDRGEWVDSISGEASAAQIVTLTEKILKQQIEVENVIKRRQVDVIGEVKNCDLSKEDCSFQEKDKLDFKVSVNVKPITTRKSFVVDIKGQFSEYTPLEIDIEGQELNMGLIRPKLKKISAQRYRGEFDLPFCEVVKMNWKAKLIFENKLSRQSAVIFEFKTLK